MSVTRFNLLLIVLIALNTSGCGEFTSASGKASGLGMPQNVKPFGTCDRKDVALFNLCMEAVGSDYNEPGYLGILHSSCDTTGGVYSTNNCDRTGSLGTCVVEAGKTNEAHTTYYPPLHSLASAQMDCDANGGIFFSH